MTLRRFARDFAHCSMARRSLQLLIVLILLSIFAELWINNKPLVLYYKGTLSFPMIQDPRGKGEPDSSRGDLFLQFKDYKNLNLQKNDWALWPPIRWSPHARNLKADYYPSPPSKVNLLGTDDRGRDLLARLVYGLRYTFLYAFAVWLLTLIASVFLSGLVTIFGKPLDRFLLKVLLVWESLPPLLLIMGAVTLFPPRLSSLIFFSTLFGGLQIFYFIREEIHFVHQSAFIEASSLLGASRIHNFLHHTLPHALISVTALSPLMFIANISLITKLDYFGFGLPAPTPNWGELLYQGQKYWGVTGWLFWVPTGAIVLTLVLLTAINHGVQVALRTKVESSFCRGSLQPQKTGPMDGQDLAVNSR